MDRPRTRNLQRILGAVATILLVISGSLTWGSGNHGRAAFVWACALACAVLNVIAWRSK